MARVRSFRAHTYTRTSPDISLLTAPPYDVVSLEQRAALLAGSPRNVVALELPAGSLDPSEPGNRYVNGAALWKDWVATGVVSRDTEPSIHVLEQHFELDGRRVRRRAFVAAVGLEPFDAGVILPHERTLPKALSDRLELLRATRVNTSPVFGLFSDPERLTDNLFDSATAAADPTLRAVDADGVESLLWSVSDTDWIARLEAFMAAERIFIADGHHRYTVALSYRDERRAAASAGGDVGPGCNSVMMALANMDDPDLVVLPTHRVADAAGPFDPGAFLEALSERFTLKDLARDHPAGALATAADTPSFVVRIAGVDPPKLASLRPEIDLDAIMGEGHTPQWNRLDVAVLQELVLDPLLDIHPDRPESLERVAFVKDAHDALAMAGEHDVAFVLNPTRMDQMRAVAIAGETMPQKSTYFYPKMLSGMLFRALD